jgi:DNA-binding transcriptional ArsR family regulator
MVKYSQASLDITFAALSDPIRRATVERLVAGDAGVGELAAPHGVTLAAMLKHLGVLERAGLVTTRKVGRSRICHLRPDPLKGAMAWLQHYHRFWSAQLASLDHFLASSSADPWTPPPTSLSKSVAATRPRRSASSPRGPKRKR